MRFPEAVILPLYLSFGLMWASPSMEQMVEFNNSSPAEKRRLFLLENFIRIGWSNEIVEFGNGDFNEGLALLGDWLQNDPDKIVPVLFEQMKGMKSDEPSRILSIFGAFQIESKEITDFLLVHMNHLEGHEYYWQLSEPVALPYFAKVDTLRHRKILEKLAGEGNPQANILLEKKKNPEWKPDEAWLAKFRKNAPQITPPAGVVAEPSQTTNTPQLAAERPPYGLIALFGIPIVGIGAILLRSSLRHRQA